MTRREWLLSLFFVAFILLKAAEGVFQLESWPLTHVPMFATYVPSYAAPYRVTLMGTRGGPWFDLTAGDFLLGEEEYRRRLPRDPVGLAARCAEFGRLYNARQPAAARLTELRGRVVRVPRPGMSAESFEFTVRCPLAP